MTNAAAKGRSLLFLAAAFVFLTAILAAPAAEATRTLPAIAEPAQATPRATLDVLEDAPPKPPTQPEKRLRLFEDLGWPTHPLELVQISKTASGVFDLGLDCNVLEEGGLSQDCGSPSFQGLWHDPLTGLAYARNRWYDASTASWLSEDPLGPVDSPNLYAFVAWGPHAATDPMGTNLVSPSGTLDPGSPHYRYEGSVYRVTQNGMVWEQVVSQGFGGVSGYRVVWDRETIEVVLAMAGRSAQTDFRTQRLYLALTAELSEEEQKEARADVFCALPGIGDVCDVYTVSSGKEPFTGRYLGPVEYSSTTVFAALPIIGGHTANKIGRGVLGAADDVAGLIPGSAEHKAQRWLDYQDRGGHWGYDQWSKVYDHNMTRARVANKQADDYWGRIGWGAREVTVDVAPGIKRRLDIADSAARRAVEHKTGRQYATVEVLWEVARDQELRRQGWDIQWHFEGSASRPLLDALERAGIPHNLGGS